jgi:hypothetical protein
VKEKMSLGPTTLRGGKKEDRVSAEVESGEARSTHRTLGVSPLKKAPAPSFLRRSRTTVIPPTLDSKFWFWMRVFEEGRDISEGFGFSWERWSSP